MEGGENNVDFLPFLQLQLTKPVVQLHHGGGLDEIGGACGGLVVDHAV